MINVQNTHKNTTFDKIHDAKLTIRSMVNHPQHDELIVKYIYIRLIFVRFVLLVDISGFGPIGEIKLADQVGGDPTTSTRRLTPRELRDMRVTSAAPYKRIFTLGLAYAHRTSLSTVPSKQKQLIWGVYRG